MSALVSGLLLAGTEHFPSQSGIKGTTGISLISGGCRSGPVVYADDLAQVSLQQLLPG